MPDRGRMATIVAVVGVALITAAWGAVAPARAADPRWNVLFISVDDLRPALGCYGDRRALTPSIDRLAAGGRTFLSAYCAQAVCGPSRSALFTGRLPDQTRVWHNRHRFRDTLPDAVTLPQAFLRAGWTTMSLGKVLSGDEREEDPASWSVPAVLRAKGWKTSLDPRSAGKGKGLPWERLDVGDDAYPDGRIADLAIGALTEAATAPRPFFLAVGFLKPHLPFNAPARYWDRHDPEALGTVPFPEPTPGAPALAWPDHRELAGYRGMPADERVDAATARDLRHGYSACVSYVDAQVGRVLDALDRLGLASRTIVVLWGDHGYSLGEGDHWCKATNFERDTRVPLVIRVPGMARPGASTPALVELVDLYPTLTGLAGVPAPAGLAGRSLVPLLDDPAAPGREVALSQFARPFRNQDPETMGYSLRSPSHRYTRWVEWPSRRTVAEELYAYDVPVADGRPLVEERNLIGDEAVAPVRDRLRATLDTMLADRIGPPLPPRPRTRATGGDGD